MGVIPDEQPAQERTTPAPTPLDQLAAGLQDQRLAAGSPSYAEIVVRIVRLRGDRGVPEAERRPAKTTVYDAFRPGRRRIDVGLVLDIVRALGADEAGVREWEERCRRALRGEAPFPAVEPGPPVPAPAPPAASAPTVPHPAPVPQEPAVPAVGPPPVTAPVQHAAPPLLRVPASLAPRTVAIIVVLSVLLNLTGRALTDVLPMPLYLDMTGNAVTAILLGPWWGVLVALVSCTSGMAFSGWLSLAFTPVSVAGALLWGYGVRRYDGGRTLGSFFGLNLRVAVLCTAVAFPIVVALGGVTENAADDVTSTVVAATGVLWVAVLVSNLVTSVADKMIAGFAALAVADAVARRHHDAVPETADRALVNGTT